MVEIENLKIDYVDVYKEIQEEFKSEFIESIDLQKLFQPLSFMKVNEEWFRIPGQPEAYTSKFVKKLFDKVGLPSQSLPEQTTLKRKNSVFHKRLRRYPDYMVIKGEGSAKGLLLEIESIGKDLEMDIEKFQNKTYIHQDGKKDHLSGIAQVLEWYSEFTGLEKDYDGLATNFVDWYSIFHSEEDYQMKWVKISVSEALDFILRVAKGTSPDYTTKNYEVYYKKIEDFYKLFNERLSYIISNIKEEECKRPDINVLNIPSGRPLEEQIKIGVSTYRTNFFRLLFLRILEEWKLIPFDPVAYIFTKIGPAQPSLFRQLFFEVFNQTIKERKSNPDIDKKFNKLPYLNGGLFRKTESEKYINVKLSSIVYKDIWSVLSSFSFTRKKSENDHINPEILGYIFERTLEATGERKKTGTYFTPDIITHYMAKELIHADSVDKLNRFIKLTNVLNYPIDNIEEIDTLKVEIRKKLFTQLLIILKDIKICDNACGSGAFLKSCGDELVYLYKKIYDFFSWELVFSSRTPKGKRPFKSLFNLKRYILQESLFGVDYLESATELCQLRLWLWLVEPSSGYKNEMLKDSLPNIDFNIRWGNSLVGYHNFDMDQSLENKNKSLITLIEDYYMEKNNSKKDEEIRDLLFHLRAELYDQFNKQFRINTSKFFENMKKEKNIQDRLKKSRDYTSRNGQLEILNFLKIFHWNVDFYNILKTGGFDILIGNPPYVRADVEDDFHILQRELLKSLNKEYPSLFEKWDVFVAFIELSFRYLLKENGKFGYIVSNALCTVKYAKRIREFLVTEHKISSINFIEDFEVFKGIGVIPIIFFAEHHKTPNKVLRKFRSGSFNNIIKEEEIPQEDVAIFKKEDLRVLGLDYENCVKLGNICYISKGMVLNADEKKFKGEFYAKDLISDVRSETNNRPYIDGKDSERFKINRIRYLEWDSERCPAKISRKTFTELYHGTKIIRGRMNEAVLDNSNILTSANAIVFKRFVDLREVNNTSIKTSIKKNNIFERNVLENLSGNYQYEYLICLINSTLANKYLNAIRRHKQKNYFYPGDFRKFPIKNFRNQNLFINLEHYLEYLYVYDKTKAEKLDELVDYLVYEVYFVSRFQEDGVYENGSQKLIKLVQNELLEFNYEKWYKLYWKQMFGELNQEELAEFNTYKQDMDSKIESSFNNIFGNQELIDIISRIRTHHWVLMPD